ncbi:MAG: hypothetical protein ABIA04_14230 [Pseudomonadota bacterium]
MYKILSIINLVAFLFVISTFLILIFSERSKKFVDMAGKSAIALIGMIMVFSTMIFLAYK